MMITIGSLFSGIGGFELGFERGIPGSKTIWQCEQDSFCQKVLKKHWSDAIIYDDVRQITKKTVSSVDILLGGFPCQGFSNVGKMDGLNDERSNLWWEMHRIINEIRPQIVCMENVPAITIRGGGDVISSLASIGYDVEWSIISGREMGAPHRRDRWFAVAYSNSFRSQKIDHCTIRPQINGERIWVQSIYCSSFNSDVRDGDTKTKNYWEKNTSPDRICRVDDGVSRGMDANRLKALGNAIVPQCSEYVAKCILHSGLIDNLLQKEITK